MIQYKLIAEISEQPFLFESFYLKEFENIREIARVLSDRKIRRIVAAGCGDAFSNAMAAKAYFDCFTDIPSSFVEPFDFVNGSKRDIDENDAVLVFSAKGKSKLILEFLRNIKDANAAIICVTNEPDGAAAALSNYVINIRAGEWLAPRTKAVTLSLVAAIVLAMCLGGFDREQIDIQIEKLIASAREMLTDGVNWDAILHDCSCQNAFTFVGYGINYPAAYYAKAKSKEILRWRSDIYHIEEFAHIETVAPSPDQFTVFLFNDCNRGERVFEIIKSAAKLQRRVIVFADGDICDRYADNNRDVVWIAVPKATKIVSSVLYYIAIQLLHYNAALIHKIDPDNPPTRLFARQVAFDEKK